MYALLPSTLVPCQPQQSSFPSTKPQRHNLSSSSTNNSAHNPKPKITHLSAIPIATSSEQTHPFIEWPQLLQTSIGSGDFKLGQAIHAHLTKLGIQNETFQGNNIINLYAKFGRLVDAQKLFDEMFIRNTITWTTLIKGYLDINDVESVFRIASDMYRRGEQFNEHTCSVVLLACNEPEHKIFGVQMHCVVVKYGFEENVFVGTSLVSMYSGIGSMDDAEKVYNGMSYKDVKCLNFMISEYGKVGDGERAIQVFLHLLSTGLEPSDFTFTNVISSCSSNTGVKIGRQLHGLAVKCGFVGSTSVGNALVTMYGKYGLLKEAERIFHEMDEKNLVSWTALISGHVKNGQGESAVSLFLEMLGLGVQLDSSCLSTVLDGCSECNNLELGHQIHGLALKLGCLFDINVATALIDLYAKHRNLHSARLVLNSVSCVTTASFNAILVGFMNVDGEDEENAMGLFNQLRIAGVKPDGVSFARLLCLSATQACLSSGKCLHSYAKKTGFESDTAVGNSVITMYAKCGSVEDAYQMFNSMKYHDAISWNAMISAYALHGHGKMAVLLFKAMEKKAVIPDEITMLSVLQACSHSCLWEDGLRLFNEMETKYGIQPKTEHFSCMVDLLGRAGHLSDAIKLINRSPFSDSPLLWRTLVHGCKLHRNLYFGKKASKRLLELAPEEAGSYILISNMYADEGMLDEAAKVRTIMTDLKVEKEAGCSWIEIDNKVHRFLASSKDHPQCVEIYQNLDLLKTEIKQEQNDRADLLLVLEPI